MLRIFLKKKIDPKKFLSGFSKEKIQEVTPKERRRFERFDIDYKHLTVMNDADILTIRDVSLDGFSTEVSPRCFERLYKNDIFEARLRYAGELYDLTARVAWKGGNIIGFQILEAPSATMLFFRRLIAAAKIGNSLLKTEQRHEATSESEVSKEWFHSREDADLFVWRQKDTGHVTAWQLTAAQGFVEWSDALGLVTGSLYAHKETSQDQIARQSGQLLRPDNQPDPQKKQFAVDVLMALRDPLRDEIVATLTTPDRGE